MKQVDLERILEKHKEWLEGKPDGVKADLCHADLCHADLCHADLRESDIDFSCWPLWCGSLDVKVDGRIAAQLLYHVLKAMQSCTDDPGVAKVLASPANIALANRFHRARECGRIGKAHR